MPPIPSLVAWLREKKWLLFAVAACVAFVMALVGAVVLAVRLHAAEAARDSALDQLTDAQVVTRLNDTQFQEYTARTESQAWLRDQAEDLRPAVGSDRIVYLTQTKVVYQPVRVEVPGVVTDPGTGTTPVDPPALRVDFEAHDAPMHAKGYTLTNPGTAHLDLWIDPLALDVIVTRGKDGRIRTLFDTHTQKVSIEAARTVIDPSALDESRRWYVAGTVLTEIGDWTDLGIGVDAGYLFDRWSLGVAYLHTGWGIVDGHRVGLRVGGRF